MKIGDQVFDAAEGTGRITCLYRKGDQDMATVEYTSPQWNGDYEMEWDVRDLQLL